MQLLKRVGRPDLAPLLAREGEAPKALHQMRLEVQGRIRWISQAFPLLPGDPTQQVPSEMQLAPLPVHARAAPLRPPLWSALVTSTTPLRPGSLRDQAW